MEELTTYTLEEISIGKGTYGIGAPAIPFDKNKRTYLRITDINEDGTLNKDGLMSVEEEKADEYLLAPNDIVFARTGNSTGRTYFYEESDGIFCYAGFLIKFTLNPNKVNPRILKYYTHSKAYYDWVHSFDTGGTRGNINAKTYGQMPVTLPSKERQDCIVEICKSLDDKIEVNKQINDNLEQQAQALFNEMFPHITEGENMIGNLIMPKRGKGLLSKNAIKGDIPVVAGGIEPATYHNQANTTAPVLTIAASGANAGYINLWHIPVWASDSSYIDDSITPNVYFWYIMLKKRQKEIFDAQVGSAQPHIYPKHIAELPMNVVFVEKIAEYNEIVTPIFEKKGQLYLESKRLTSLRDTLLPKLMSGELKINDINN